MRCRLKSVWEYKIIFLAAEFLVLQCVIAQFKSEESLSEKYFKPCSNYKPGEDDLQTFDFVRRYNLDVLGKHFSTRILKVKGSDRMQTAYRLDKEADVTIRTKDIFPFGLPDEFSLVITIRNNKLSKAPWQLMRIYNFKNDSEFAIILNPKRQTIEFFTLDLNGTKQLILFSAPQIFNKNWHKIHFGVFFQSVVLYIDCKKIDTKRLSLRGFIDVSGNISLAKVLNGNATVPIDLQWMVLNCDPTRTERESCEEIPEKSQISEKAYNNKSGNSGLTGEREDSGSRDLEGSPGSPGSPGFPGFSGSKGDIGMPGPMGPPGPPCVWCYPNPNYSQVDKKMDLPGSPEYLVPISDVTYKNFVFEDQKAGGFNLRELVGPTGKIGEPGPERLIGPPGIPGKDGITGMPGKEGERCFPGKSGEPGPQGLPGKKVREDIIRDICLRIWSEKISEMMQLIEAPLNVVRSRPGRRGPQGPPGPPGNPGVSGEKGSMGPPGQEGPSGFPGADGQRGEKGEKGEAEIGHPGPTGFPGIQGPQGNDGRPGQPGRQGERGEPGRPGQPGSHGQPGIPGPPGFCEFCNYQNLQYNEKGL